MTGCFAVGELVSSIEPSRTNAVRRMNLSSPIARRVRTALFVTLFLALTCMPHGGAGALVLLPFFICSWLYELFVLVRRPEQRARRAERVIIWMLAFCVSGTVNLYWFRASRAYANDVANAILNYRARTGTYPTDLQEVGVPPERALRRWMLVYAVGNDGRPLLAYAVPWEVFDTYDYDFKTGQWTYWAD